MSSVITLYGIKNCDSVKKSRKWLDKNSIRYVFHDFRLDGVKRKMIKEFLENIEIELLINKRSTSWRKLSGREREMERKKDLIELLLNNPTIMKRPIIKTKNKYLVGFNEKELKLLK